MAAKVRNKLIAFELFFDAKGADQEYSTVIKSVSIKGAKQKFRREWGKEYKINRYQQQKQP